MNTGVFRPSQIGAATYDSPLLAIVFIRSPLFSDLANAMTLEMTLAPNVSRTPRIENVRR